MSQKLYSKIKLHIDLLYRKVNNDCMTRKTILFLTSLFISIVFFGRQINAQETTFSQMFGQEHFYTVILRGNGEAAIHSKFIFTNTEEATMSAMTLKTPDIAVKDIVGYQVIREPQCDEFEPVKYLPYNPDVTPTPYVQPKCRKYGEPDYYNQYFYGKTSYKKLKIAISGDQINVSLPEKVSPEKSGSIIMYYHTDNYTQKEFGGTYKYEIKTLKSEVPIKQIQVGVITDSDLKMRSPDAKVQYNTGESTMKKLMAVGSDRLGFSANARTSAYYQEIGQGALTKTAYDLQPFDSFKVTGSYADSNLKLYSKELSIGSVAGLLILAGIVFFSRKAYKNLKKSKPVQSSVEAPQVQSHHLTNTILLTGALSFISAILMSGYLLFVYLLISALGYYGNQSVFVPVRSLQQMMSELRQIRP
jgi:hypothetical protein